MDGRLLEAAISGDAQTMKLLALNDPGVLFGTTPWGNTCLHIACIQGHEEFCKEVLTLHPSLPLLSAMNMDGETPLLTAVTRGRASLASALLRCCRDQHLSETILKQDRFGCNALHHAVRRGERTLALELIEAEPALSKAVTKIGESPMFIAVMRNFTDVLDKLLEIPDSAHSGAFGFNVLHAAVRNGNPVMAKRVMEKHPLLARQENENNNTPMHLAAFEDKLDVFTVLLEHDRSLGYLISTVGAAPLLCVAASQGHVGIARELLKQCPDAPYSDADGSTCLHIALLYERAEFIEFVLGSQQLRHIINMANNKGETALHLAAKKYMMNIIAAHPDIDVTVLDNAGNQVKALPSMDDNTAPTSSSPGLSAMDGRLQEAAAAGDSVVMRHLATHDPDMLLGTTLLGNTCLHIASAHGHEGFCKAALALKPSLLAAVNSDGETALLTAVASGRVSLASVLLRLCREQRLSETILMQDKHGCNALHHAVRGGHRKLSLDLIEAEPALSKAVNQYAESPMFIAVLRNDAEVFEKLLGIPDSAHGGADGWNALHAAVRNGNSAIAKKIMETRPWLAREENEQMGTTPMHMVVLWGKTDMLTVLLEHDRHLGYVINKVGTPLLVIAAGRGHVGVARELLKHCPDAPSYNRINGWTCLHQAVAYEQTEFVEFVLGSPQLGKLVNIRRKNDGRTALHLAVEKCNPKMVAALLRHPDIDVTVMENDGVPAAWLLFDATDHAKTLNWNEVFMLMSEADPQDAGSIYNLHKEAKDKVTNLSRKDIKSLTQTYTGNTSLVAILIATITFAAAFTLPGGYSNDAGGEGLPIMAKKAAFQAFLISDTIAMCSSLVVAFVCIIARWEDLEFLLYYRSFTKKLMWLAYVATTTAFATGLYTVLAPRLLWLAIAVCVLTGSLPIFTKLLGEWPIWKLRFCLGRKFQSDLLNMV
ncbi:hypothetical protein PVAP13_8NG293652 [Panicum virgatum]|uniref:PGG domain-containing protein n=1 Tax=Panicum virgatum TaxID=38727 RepID=A0A8T0PEZ3_PANVG|nr:hypothetical protein PVAP13_8NG293652 [Panicum virgatum]